MKENDLFWWRQPAATYSSTERLAVSSPVHKTGALTILCPSGSEAPGKAISAWTSPSSVTAHPIRNNIPGKYTYCIRMTTDGCQSLKGSLINLWVLFLGGANSTVIRAANAERLRHCLHRSGEEDRADLRAAINPSDILCLPVCHTPENPSSP